MGDTRNAYKNMDRGKLRTTQRGWENNIKTDLREVMRKSVDWSNLAQGRVTWQALVDTAVKPVSIKVINFLTGWTTFNSSARTPAPRSQAVPTNTYETALKLQVTYNVGSCTQHAPRHKPNNCVPQSWEGAALDPGHNGGSWCRHEINLPHVGSTACHEC
jgi:hypothetical protein